MCCECEFELKNPFVSVTRLTHLVVQLKIEKDLSIRLETSSCNAGGLVSLINCIQFDIL